MKGQPSSPSPEWGSPLLLSGAVLVQSNASGLLCFEMYFCSLWSFAVQRWGKAGYGA